MRAGRVGTREPRALDGVLGARDARCFRHDRPHLTTQVTQTRSDLPWADIRAEWQQSEYGAARRELAALGGEAAKDVHDLLFGDEEPGRREAETVLHGAFEAVSGTRGGELLLALYVYGLCLEKWEKTEDHHTIRDVLDGLVGAHAERASTRPSSDPEAKLLSLLVRQAELLDRQLGVFDAVNCSCPVATGERAREAVAGLTPLAAELAGLSAGELGQELAGLRDTVRDDAVADARYFERIAEAADVVLAFIEDPAVPAQLDSVLDKLAAAEQDPALQGDVYPSELRAHRATLEGLRDHADAPQLLIDEAEVVYVYPFALAPVAAAEAVERALGDDVVGALERAGFGPASARELELNDLWLRGDSSQSGYSGVSIELPDLRVETTAYEWLDEADRDEALLTLSVEVRLSRLGNHFVRFQSSLGEAGLHDVNQALRRGSRAMGAEKLTSEGRPARWDKVPDYAEEVIGKVAEGLGAAPVTNLNARFHVVLAARSISVRSPGLTTSAKTLADLEGSVGATLLFHPVRHLASSLEEWIRYPMPTVVNLLGEQGYTGDVVARTDNTTVMFMPSSPEWLIDEYQEMVEFVASIPPLLTLASERARAETAEVAQHLVDEVVPELTGGLPLLEPELVPTGTESATEPVDPIGWLYLQQLEIRALESGIRADLGFLGSPALCRTRGQRRFLDALWAAAGLPVLERELERQLQLLAEQYERIAVMVSLTDERHRREQQRRAEDLRAPVELAIGLLTAASLVGVFQWMNDAFGVERDVWLGLETAALLLIAAILAGIILRAGRS